MGEEAAERADARLMAVAGIAQAVAAAHTPLDAARSAVGRVRAALAGDFASVSVWERERGCLRVLVNDGALAPGERAPAGGRDLPGARLPRDRGAPARRVGRPAADRTPGWRTPATRCPHRRVAALRRRGRDSCVVAPIVLHGRAWGELYVARGAGAAGYRRADADFATVLAAVVAAGIAQTERLEEVRRLAFTDPLTGLANRRAVDARLDGRWSGTGPTGRR